MDDLPLLVVVSEIRLYREGLASLLRHDSHVRSVNSCGSNDSELAVELQRSPKVILLDAAIRNSVQLTRQLHADLTVIVLGVPDDRAQIVEYIEAGAHGYIRLGAAVEDVMTTVESALRGELLCSRKVAAELRKRLVAVSPAQRQPEKSPFSLTDREEEVMQLIAGGESNKAIACSLHISISTVKNHVHNVLDKLKVKTRAKAARKWRDRMPSPFTSRSPAVREKRGRAS